MWRWCFSFDLRNESTYDSNLLWLVLFYIHLPHFQRGSDSAPARERHLGPSVAGRFQADERVCHSARFPRRSSTSHLLSHLPGPHSVLQMRPFHVVFQVLSCAIYPSSLPEHYLRLTSASLRGSGRQVRQARSFSLICRPQRLDLIYESRKASS